MIVCSQMAAQVTSVSDIKFSSSDLKAFSTRWTPTECGDELTKLCLRYYKHKNWEIEVPVFARLMLLTSASPLHNPPSHLSVNIVEDAIRKHYQQLIDAAVDIRCRNNSMIGFMAPEEHTWFKNKAHRESFPQVGLWVMDKLDANPQPVTVTAAAATPVLQK